MVEGADTDFDGAETYCNGLGEVTGHTTSLISIEDAYEVRYFTRDQNDEVKLPDIKKNTLV